MNEGNLNANYHLGFGDIKDQPQWTLTDHAARIGWLIVNGWDDPIELDFGTRSFGADWNNPLLDGHHRLAAAIFLQDLWILANCSGDVEEIERFKYSQFEKIGDAMICVKQHGTNYLTLKGNCLKDGTMQQSCIALHPTGWAITIHTDNFFDTKEGLDRNAVFPAIHEMLANFHEEEELNEGELNHYMNIVEAKFGSIWTQAPISDQDRGN